MRNGLAKHIALGGLLAAVAVVIMLLGSLIPFATFVCPMLCVLIQYVVFRICGRRIAWSWFGVVALLSILLGPDKEAALIFCILGYYPILQPSINRSKLRFLWKMLLFNGSIALAYGLLLRLLGLDDVMQEYQSMGFIGLAVSLVLGNACFLLLDRLLLMLSRKTFKRK